MVILRFMSELIAATVMTALSRSLMLVWMVSLMNSTTSSGMVIPFFFALWRTILARVALSGRLISITSPEENRERRPLSIWGMDVGGRKPERITCLPALI